MSHPKLQKKRIKQQILHLITVTANWDMPTCCHGELLSNKVSRGGTDSHTKVDVFPVEKLFFLHKDSLKTGFLQCGI